MSHSFNKPYSVDAGKSFPVLRILTPLYRGVVRSRMLPSFLIVGF
jgi:hypothetical protein